tara:strand:+ start:39 stop:1394 length:1356 start_codon:yes stop_codon:yes gene_type:complete
MQLIVAFTFLSLLFFPAFSFAHNPLLIFSGDLRGEIKPCGCAEEGDMGGLLRRLTFIKQKHSIHGNLLYFDLGNNFPEPSQQGDLKIPLIHSAMEKFSPEAVLVGPNEWLNGLHWLDSKIPYLLSNQSTKLNFLNSKIIHHENHRILVLGYLSPSLVYQNKNEPSVIFPVNQELLSDWGKKIQKNTTHFRVLLFRGKENELDLFDKSGMFDLIVAGSNNDDELNQVLKIQAGTKYHPMIPTKGQGILTGKLGKNDKIQPDNQETVSEGLSVSWLRRDIEDDPDLLDSFMIYDAAVKELFFRNLDLKKEHLKDSPFIGNQVCAGCHPGSTDVWKKSRHSNAFATLENLGKHFDPECLECHVVGLKPWVASKNSSEAVLKFEGKRGFLSSELTPHLKNVQCENCHGPARDHLVNSKIKPAEHNPASVCADCHHGSHSPLFEFERYWQKIKHGP